MCFPQDLLIIQISTAQVNEILTGKAARGKAIGRKVVPEVHQAVLAFHKPIYNTIDLSANNFSVM